MLGKFSRENYFLCVDPLIINLRYRFKNPLYNKKREEKMGEKIIKLTTFFQHFIKL